MPLGSIFHYGQFQLPIQDVPECRVGDSSIRPNSASSGVREVRNPALNKSCFVPFWIFSVFEWGLWALLTFVQFPHRVAGMQNRTNEGSPSRHGVCSTGSRLGQAWLPPAHTTAYPPLAITEASLGKASSSSFICHVPRFCSKIRCASPS